MSTTVDPTARTQPTCLAAPTAKLTDANNAEQPGLSFQHKAVNAFHARQAQETASVASVPNTPIDSTAAPLACEPDEPTVNEDTTSVQ